MSIGAVNPQTGIPNGLPAALGYQQHDWWYEPVFMQGFLTNFICSSIGEQIAMTNCANMTCGDTAFFRKLCQPRIYRLDAKNQTLKHDYYSGTTKQLRITEYWYSNFKIDDIDKRHWCNYPAVRAMYAEMLGKKFGHQADESLFADMIMGADCHNRGNNAGLQCRGYKLGTCEKPQPVSIDDIHLYISSLMGVLEERCDDSTMQPFLVVPKCWMHYLRNNERLSSYFHAGNCLPCSPLLTGRVNNEIMGFELMYSDRLPKVTVNGKTGHYILFGYKNATCFARGFERFDTVQAERSFGSYDRAVMSWGHEVLYPELLGHGVACLV